MGSPHDGNRIPTLKAVLNTDGVTVSNVLASPTTFRLASSDGTAGSDFGVPTSQRDHDRVTVLMAVSATDGTTPVEVYCNSSGQLLIQST